MGSGSADLVGPLPRSSKGHSYILVVTDYLTKFPIVVPLRQATSGTIVREIEERIFLLFGVPRLFICDYGVQFRSGHFRNLMSTYKVTIKYTSFYHARANPTERINRTLKTMLSIYASEDQRKWDVNLQKVACAIRTAKHEIIGMTPYFILFGRAMCLSGDDYSRGSIDGVEKDDSVEPKPNCERLKSLFQSVRAKLETANRKATRVYNLRRRYEEYAPGQSVWKKNFALSDAGKHFSNKLAPKYVGTLTIYKKISPWTYILKDANGGILEGSWHARDLKRGPDKSID